MEQKKTYFAISTFVITEEMASGAMALVEKGASSYFAQWIHSLFEVAGGHRLTHTLLPRSFCSLEHFTSKWLGTLCSPTHFAPQHTLLVTTLYSSAHFASWNTLLPRTLWFLCSREQSMLRRTFYKGAKCSKEQSIPGSKKCLGAKCFRKQCVPGI